MSKVQRFWKNVYFFLLSGKAKKKIDHLEAIQHSMIKELLLLKYTEKAKVDKDLQMALDYLQRTGDFCMIPYDQKGERTKVDCGFDKTCQLPYVLHNGKKLYFPKAWKESRVAYVYSDYVDSESLTGKGLKECTPHQYQSEEFKVEDGDVLIDVGCAEALFALDVIEKVSKVYLIENDKQWCRPLELTFAPWKDKVVILHKTLGGFDSNDIVSLKSLMEQEKNRPIFVKMDIEGGELPAIQGCQAFLQKTTQKLKVACCVYHRVNDAAMIEQLMKDCGFSVSYSSGYVLTDFLDESMLPTLRKGIIRAEKKLI